MKFIFMLFIGLCFIRVSFTQIITIDQNDTGRKFEGIGGVSAGASSRLIYDYPEPQRSQILDFLFKPNFGANIQHLKVEIGNDANTTCGSEPSHARTRVELENHVYTRGYEYWLMSEARKRNPGIVLNALEWGTPSWTNGHWTKENASYIIKFIEGAKKQWGLDMDYISPGRNEDPINADWLVNIFKPALDEAGFGKMKILAPDDNDHHWETFDDFKNNPDYEHIVDAVGYHYINGMVVLNNKNQFPSTEEAKKSGKSLWASEDWAMMGNWSGAYTLASICNIFYIRDRITMTSVWCPIDGIYSNLPWEDIGLMSADQPWSGHYDVEPPVWAMAHFNQFAKTGWIYLDKSCMALDNGGNMVALKSFDGKDFSIIITNGSSSKNIEFNLEGKWKVKQVNIWKSDSIKQFVKLNPVEIKNNKFSLNLDPVSVYSVTTTDYQTKGTYAVPPKRPFPIPYEDSFDSSPLTHPGKFFADVEGSFEIVKDGDNQCLKQMLDNHPHDWVYDVVYGPDMPATVIGDTSWSDYSVTCGVKIDAIGSAGIMGRITGDMKDQKNGISFCINNVGDWELKLLGNGLKSGMFEFRKGVYHKLRLEMKGPDIKGYIDGKQVFNVQVRSNLRGMAGLQTDYNQACFDNFKIEEIK